MAAFTSPLRATTRGRFFSSPTSPLSAKRGLFEDAIEDGDDAGEVPVLFPRKRNAPLASRAPFNPAAKYKMEDDYGDGRAANAEILADIADLSGMATNVTVIGKVVAFEGPRSFTSRKDGMERFVRKLVIKDNTGVITVVIWSDARNEYADFSIGARVRIVNPEVRPKQQQQQEAQQDLDWTTTMFELHVSFGKHASIAEFSGSDRFARPNIVQPFRWTHLEEIDSKSGRLSSILVAVTSVGPVQSVNRRNGSGPLSKRDVVVCDTTRSAVTLTLWGDVCASADGWDTPGSPTVLFVTQARAGEFRGSLQLSTTFRSWIDVNINVPYANQLRAEAAKCAVEQPSVQYSTDAAVIRDEPVDAYTVCEIAAQPTHPPTQCSGEFMLTACDIDGPEPIVKTFCPACSKAVEEQGCDSCGKDASLCDQFYSLRCSFGDASGSVTSVPLDSAAAQSLLDVPAGVFAAMTPERRTDLKHRLLFRGVSVDFFVDKRAISATSITLI